MSKSVHSLDVDHHLDIELIIFVFNEWFAMPDFYIKRLGVVFFNR